MKRIKSVNGYTIYQAVTERDAENYNCQVGNYNIYIAQDIRDFGLTNSYPEYDNIDSLTYALVICNGSHYAVAVALADELSQSTAQNMGLTLAIEQRLDAGEAVSYVRDCYDPETGILHAKPAENPYYLDSDHTWLDDVIDQYVADCHADDDDEPLDLDDDDEPLDLDDDDDLADDDLDPDQVIDDLAAGKLDDIPEGTWYTSVALEGSLRQELIASVATPDRVEEIENYGIWGMAVLEIGYTDIEVNITHDGDKLCAEYFVCLKDSAGDWHGWGYIDRQVTIDWSAPNWRELLREEMREELCRFTTDRAWSICCPMDAVIDGLYTCPGYNDEPGPDEEEPAPEEPAQPERKSHASYYVVCCDGEYITCTASHDPELRPEWKRNAFFRDIAERIAFSDCSYDTVEEIVWDGEPCRYAGWQPGMLMEFVSELTGEIVYSNSFPEWDH